MGGADNVNNYQQKSWNDSPGLDLETFLGKKDNVGHSEEVSSNAVFTCGG